METVLPALPELERVGRYAEATPAGGARHGVAELRAHPRDGGFERFAALDRAALRRGVRAPAALERSEEHTSELQSQSNLVCRLLLEKKKKTTNKHINFL